MKVGDVITTFSVRHEFTHGSLGYKAPKGQRFVLVLLGVEDKADDGEKLDCEAVFKALGWVRGSQS